MDFQLRVVRGRSTLGTLKLNDGNTIVGRHDACQLRIKSAQVSRKHCELFEKKGLLLVKDLGSSNGTLVNGKRVQGQRVLEPGDELSIGPVLLRVEKVAGSAPSAKKAASPGDTAITAAAAASDSAGDADDFTIDFDEPTEAPPEAAAVAAPAPAPAHTPKAPPQRKPPAHDE